MNGIRAYICFVFGIFATAIIRFFGGWAEDMITLITVMAIDFLMGIFIAFVFKKSPKSESGAVSSKSCFRGLCKKCAILFFVLIAHRLDITLGTDYIKTATVVAFIVNELISVIENAGLMGVPMPDIILKAIELLKNKSEIS